MATTTPNYGWTVPTSSDLVKNGATAIETLGDSVDDSLWNSGYGQASKNKVINGDFSINQRAFTTTTTSNVYTFDRFRTSASDGTSTFSAQTFTAGTAPVAGYESTNFLNIASTGQTLTSARTSIEQRIENVRTFAGQTVTISFWAKAASGTPSITPELAQIFGTGGSTAVTAIGATKTALTTSWARYTISGISVPSIAGKTISATDSELRLTFFTSAGSDLNSRTQSLGIQTATISLWGVQVEYGSKATAFQTASGGSLQGELAMCQRYYYRNTAGLAYAIFSTGFCTGTTAASFGVQFPVPMRIAPASIDTTGTAANYAILSSTGAITACSAVPVYDSNTSANVGILVGAVTAGLVAGNGTQLRANNAVTAYIGWSAEL